MQILNNFIEDMAARCQAKPGRLALPEGNDPRVIQAAEELLAKAVVRELYLFGSPALMKTLLKNTSRDDARLILIDSSDLSLQSETLHHFEARAAAKGKSLTADEKLTTGISALNQAAYFLATNKVDAAVGGCLHTTADVIRAVLKGVGMKPGIKTLSGSFVMIRGQETYLYGDCGVVADPNPEQLADIAQATAETLLQFFPQLEPKIAFLSFSTKGSAEHTRVNKVQEGAAIFQARNTGLLADGELQFDAALLSDVGQRKAPGSLVAGRANCFIFPDLDSGNIAYKITQRLAGFDAYGPILQGSAKPYLDLSRGASAKDIMVSGILAMLRA